MEDLREEWQPIETAPLDGTQIVLHVDWKPLTVVGFYGCDRGQDDKTWRVDWDHTPIRDGFAEPTHWMPLPDPPQRSTETKQADGPASAPDDIPKPGALP